VAREEQRQRAADDARATDTDVERSGHEGHCRSRAQSRLAFATDPSHPMSNAPDVTARIERLFVYPVKSCSGIELKEALLTEAGLDLDRAWMVVDERGEFVTQRELPRMALVRPQLKIHEVVLRAPGMLALHLAIDTVEEPVR